MITDEELHKAMEEKDYFKDFVRILEENKREIAYLSRRVEKMENLLNGEIDKKLNSIMEIRINEILKKYNL